MKWARIMAWFLPHHRSADAAARHLDATVAEAVLANEAVTQVAHDVTASAEIDQALAEEVAGATRERLALLEARRTRRTREPAISSATQALKLLERRL